MSIDVGENEITIFARLIEAGDEALTASAARYILALAFPPEERNRMHELAVRAQEGTLTAAEEFEIDGYERVGTLLSIWKSKARKALKTSRRSSK
jgi:hypothetical protein